MTTNKYESPPDYQQRKKQRLRQIQEDYFPPPPEGFFKKLFHSPTVYTPCENYTTNHQFATTPLHIHYSRKGNYILILIAIVFGGWTYIIKWGNPTANDVFGSIVIISILLYTPLKELLYRKPVLIISEQRLVFTKENLEIAWEHVVAAHILEESDGDGGHNYFLIIDYYDACSDYFKVHRFAANRYEINYQTIAATIAYCHKKVNAQGWPNKNYKSSIQTA